MKKRIGMRIFMAAVAIMMAFGAQANEIPQVLDGYRMWIFRVHEPRASTIYSLKTNGFRFVETAGDTIVGDYTMTRIRVEDVPVFEGERTVKYYAAYEADGVVSVAQEQDGKVELLPLVDFNATEGDVMERKNGSQTWELRVDKEGYIFSQNEESRRVLTVMKNSGDDANDLDKLQDPTLSRACHWIEGIGYSNECYMHKGYLDTRKERGVSYELLECYKGVSKTRGCFLKYRSEDLASYVNGYYRNDDDYTIKSFEPGKSWVTVCYEREWISDENGSQPTDKFVKAYDVRHTYAGDTIVDGKKMHKLVKTVEYTYGPYANSEESGVVSYVGFERNGAVYVKYLGTLTEIMNFGLHKGDVFTKSTTREHIYRVANDELVNVRGHNRRIMTIEEGVDTYKKTYWVEGVYATSILKSNYTNWYHDKRRYYFKACYLNDELIFSAEDLEEYKKSQQSGIEEILPAEGETGDEANPDAPDTTAPVYDLQGHRVTRQVPGQVYISQGRKWVQR